MKMSGRVCCVCGDDDLVAITPGEGDEISMASDLLVRRGVAPRAWCLTHWLDPRSSGDPGAAVPLNSQDQDDMGRKPKMPPAVVELPLETEIDEVAVSDMAAEFLCGDLRDYVLDILKHEQGKLPWNKRPEADQRATASQVEAKIYEGVKRAVEIIAAGGRKTIGVRIIKIAAKDELQVVAALPRTGEDAHRVLSALGERALLVVADVETFVGERAPAAITPDQGAMLSEKVSVIHSETQKVSGSPFN